MSNRLVRSCTEAHSKGQYFRKDIDQAAAVDDTSSNSTLLGCYNRGNEEGKLSVAGATDVQSPTTLVTWLQVSS